MEKIIARGQITIVDLNDARTASVVLEANQPVTQVYTSGADPSNAFSPNWEEINAQGVFVNNLKVSPELVVSNEPNPVFYQDMVWTITAYGGENAGLTWTGTSSVVNNNRKPYYQYWKDESDHSKGTYTQSDNLDQTTLTNLFEKRIPANDFGARIDSDGKLIIAKNMMDVDSIVIKLSAKWMDSKLNVAVPVKASISFDKRLNGGNGVLAMCYVQSSASLFKSLGNGASPEYIDMDAILIRGGEHDNNPSDSTPFFSQWFTYTKDATLDPITYLEGQDQKGNTITNYDLLHDSITDVDIPYSQVTAIKVRKKYEDKGITVVDKNTIRITPESIDSIGIFKATVTYTGEGDLKGRQFTSYNNITITDSSDPFQVEVWSTNGETYINNDINTDIVADVTFRGIKIPEVDRTSEQTIENTNSAPYVIMYDWAKFDEEGDAEDSFHMQSDFWATRNNAGEIERLSQYYGSQTFEGDLRSRQKRFSVTNSDITRKATFFVEATIFPNDNNILYIPPFGEERIDATGEYTFKRDDYTTNP